VESNNSVGGFTFVPDAADGEEAFGGGSTEHDLLANDTSFAHRGVTFVSAAPPIRPRAPALTSVQLEALKARETARRVLQARTVVLAIIRETYSFQRTFDILSSDDTHLEALEYLMELCTRTNLFLQMLYVQTEVQL
jgi:hypothetical protein